MTVQVTQIVGGQWGDEGKGKIVDLLVKEERYGVVVRYNGGNNAGHTVVVGDKKYPLHLLPSGVLHPHVKNVLAAGVVIDPIWFAKELAGLAQRGIDTTKISLLISERAHLILPWHRLLDGVQGGKIGTTGKGIGPCYSDRALRVGLRVGDLIDRKGRVDVEGFSRKFHHLAREKGRVLTEIYGCEAMETEKELAEILKCAEKMAPYVGRAEENLSNWYEEGETILYEGAQGSLLDCDWGSYPFVTSSSVGLSGALAGAGRDISPERRIAIVKAYTTRVGEGPFVSELGDYQRVKKEETEPISDLTQEERRSAIEGDDLWMGRWLRSVGCEYGTTTGRPRRCGWLDLVAVKHAVSCFGLTEIALTKLDVLVDLPKLYLCVAYDLEGERIEHVPSRLEDLEKCKPIYEECSGFEAWKEVSSWEELPAKAKDYLQKIEAYLEIPVKILSVGPKRSESILFD